MTQSDGESAGGEPATGTAPRREALKKAAGAAAVAATVWAAPRVEGLSLVPAYAAAASAGAKGYGGVYTQVQIGTQWWGLHTFTSSGRFVRTDPGLNSVEVIAVGGGGGGGLGGGGGGQVVRSTSVLVSDPSLTRKYTVVVGVGGAGRLGGTVVSGAGSNPASPNLEFEWNTQAGGNGTSSSFQGSAATILAAGGGGGGALLFYTTPGLGTTHALTLGQGRSGASGGGGGGINANAATTTNRTGGTGSNGIGSSPFNAGATSIAASAGTTTMATGQSLNPNAGFAGGPGGGWVGSGSSGGVTGTVGAGIIITPTQLDGVRRMFGQGGGGGAALSIAPTGNSRDYLVDSGYETGFPGDPLWNGNPFTGSYVGQPLSGGNNSGGAGGFVGTALDPAAYANGEAGSDGRGGGGGGGGFNWANTSVPTIVATNSGRGGNGLVVIRYPIAAP